MSPSASAAQVCQQSRNALSIRPLGGRERWLKLDREEVQEEAEAEAFQITLDNPKFRKHRPLNKFQIEIRLDHNIRTRTAAQYRK